MAASPDAKDMGKALFAEIQKGPRADLEKCHEFVEKGADLRHIGKDGNHAFILALIYNQDALAFAMLDKDPSVASLAGGNGNMPALYAVYRDEQALGEARYFAMIDKLEQVGADFLAENVVGTTPLKAAELRDAHRPSIVSARALLQVSRIAAEQEKLLPSAQQKKMAVSSPDAPTA